MEMRLTLLRPGIRILISATVQAEVREFKSCLGYRRPKPTNDKIFVGNKR